MPDLFESLQGRDLGHLHIVAHLWGIDLEEQEIQSTIRRLTTSLLDASSVKSIISKLTVEAKNALDDLIQHGGRLPWAQFTRVYGEVRELGAAKRDRERPYEHPVSAVEVLWYRAFVARAFFDTPAGPEEFAYIPDNLLELIPHAGVSEPPLAGRRALAVDYARIFLANDRILDHACTLLAAMRVGANPPNLFPSPFGEELTSTFITSLLSAVGLIDEAGRLNPEAVQKFLEANRGEALSQLYKSWKHTTLINELRLLPDIVAEGNWENDPLQPRNLILDYLSQIPLNSWWSMDSFVSAVKKRNPDFQRPGGDYDSWFIRTKTSGEYLRGFEHWEEVDGRLIRYILSGPLHWLGVLDLASKEEGQDVTAFRLSEWSRALLHDQIPQGLPLEEEKLVARSNARLIARRLVPRRVRYQIARFCEWEKETPDEYQYRVTAASLSHSRKQGLTVNQLISLINRYAQAVPPSLIQALERWDKQGSEVRMERMVVLRVVSEDIMHALLKSRASRFLGEALGPTTIAVKPGAVDKVMSALAELGYVGEIRGEVD